MKRLTAIVLVVMFLAGTISPACASGKEDAKELVEKAVAYVKANGKDKAIQEFNNPKGKFIKGELYVFVYDMNATILAHPMTPKLIGMNLLNVSDADRKYFRREIVEHAKTEGSGWEDYTYRNPKTNKMEQKTTYFKKVGDIIVCCGTYK